MVVADVIARWIDCFHACQSLGPPDAHREIEKFQKYSEQDLMHDLPDDHAAGRDDAWLVEQG